MKTLKIALASILFAFAMVSIASADGFTANRIPIKVVNLDLDRVVSIPGLIEAMYDQLDKDDFQDGSQFTYVVEVIHNGTLYRIRGTKLQWIQFFKQKINQADDDFSSKF